MQCGAFEPISRKLIEMGIPREKDGRTNPEFARMLAKVSAKELIKHYHYIPWDVLKNIKTCYFQK